MNDNCLSLFFEPVDHTTDDINQLLDKQNTQKDVYIDLYNKTIYYQGKLVANISDVFVGGVYGLVELGVRNNWDIYLDEHLATGEYELEILPPSSESVRIKLGNHPKKSLDDCIKALQQIQEGIANDPQV